MAELVEISEGYKYQHNTTKKIENRIYVTRENSKFAVFLNRLWIASAIHGRL